MKIDKNKNYRYEAALNHFSFLFFNRSVINRYKQNARLKPFVLFDVQDSHEHLSQTTGQVLHRDCNLLMKIHSSWFDYK